jgi:cysteine desulfurase
MKHQIYLDYAAATPVDDEVKKAMEPYLSDLFYNPSATYLAARQVKDELDSARSKVAHWLGSKPSEIVFTAGGTEANNIAIQGVLSEFPEGDIVISGLEHDSVYEPASQYDLKICKVAKNGFIDIEDMISKIDDQTVLVSVMLASNEIGTIQPIKEISAIIQKIRTARMNDGLGRPIYFHVDAAQAANYLDLHVSRLGVDMMTINGGKIYGPKQTGVLYIKAGTIISPIVLGGNQEQGMRSGTPNVAGAIGLAKALDIAQSMRQDEIHRLHKLQLSFIEDLQNIPNLQINGSLKNRLPNNIHITIDGIDNEKVLIQLDEAGIMAASGSACSASSEEPSKVLESIGLSKQQIQSSLRFTMGRQTTESDIKKTTQILSSLVN